MELEHLVKDLEAALLKVENETALEQVRVEFLGRKGKLAEAMSGIGALSIEEKKTAGMELNAVKEKMDTLFVSKTSEIEHKKASALAETEWIDVTAPGVAPKEGHLHLTTQAIGEIEEIFSRIGFTRVSAPDVDWDWYAFESLNIPKDHPARDNWETFFVDQPEGKKGKVVLTPHTSNSQVRELEKKQLPLRMINIGRCYRRQSDVSHIPMFHQFEGFMVDEGLSIVHLKGVLDYFARAFFGPTRRIRLRPHHFRFTEPSFEVDVSCGVCDGTALVNGEKCRLCKAGWLELGGAGMTHPSVLEAGGIDSKKYSAFAFGWGVERTLMMREGIKIDDIRVLYKNDLRFVEQF